MKAYVIATSIEGLNSRLREQQDVNVILLLNDKLSETNIYNLAHKL
jgi:hypothetical protein